MLQALERMAGSPRCENRLIDEVLHAAHLMGHLHVCGLLRSVEEQAGAIVTITHFLLRLEEPM